MNKKKVYDYKDYPEEDWVESQVMRGVKDHCLRNVIAGTGDYIIQERDSYSKDRTDIRALIINGLYPVYLKYGLNLDVLTREALEKMIDEGNSLEFDQAYQYIWHELHIREDYTNLPFTMVDKELIFRMKRSKKYKEYTLLEKQDPVFIDTEAFFTEEFNNGGRPGYVYVGREDDEYIQRRVMSSIQKGKLKEMLSGAEEEYRIITPQSQCNEVTDIYYVLEYGLYPLMLHGHKEIKELTRKAIEEMIDSCDPIDLSQVYEYVCSELSTIEKYCNYPFTILDKELIKKIKIKKNELENLLKETKVDGMTVWDGAEFYEKKFDIFSNTDEFFSQNL